MGSRSIKLLLCALALLCVPGGAQAKQIQQYFYSGQFFSAGGSSPAAIAFDGTSQKLLVVGTGDKEEGLKISKFTPQGAPAGFSGLVGEPASFHAGGKLNGTPAVAIAVDESGTATNGNFYVTSLASSGLSGAKVFGYSEAGAALPGFPFAVTGACGVAVAPDGNVWVASSEQGAYREYTASGAVTGRSLVVGVKNGGCRIAIDGAGNFYVANGERLAKYDPIRKFLLDLGAGSPHLAFDRADSTMFELSAFTPKLITQVDSSGDPITLFGGPDPAHFSFEGLSITAADLAIDPQSHDVYALNGGFIDVFSRDASTVTVPTASIGWVEGLSGSSATLTGVVNPDGIDTTACYFEWGTTVAYGKTATCAEGNVFASGSGDNSVTASIGGLKKGTVYHFRLVSTNANGARGFGRDEEFSAADPPVLGEASVDHTITSDSARVNFDVNPNGASTRYHVEIGTDTGYGRSVPIPDAEPSGLRSASTILVTQAESQEVSSLSPTTEYHYRVVAENAAGVTEGADRTFSTFALPSTAADTCANAHVRQQTGAAGLLDCRAYELVSAPNTGGYDVRSDLTLGGAPLPTSPEAAGAALYSMQSGTIPGIAGNPTNRGADPYLATRGPSGWSTRYVGLAANNSFASGPFASPLLGFDPSLNAFAFGGAEICSPCFEDGSTNVPLRLPDGSLIKGMAGSLDPGAAEPAGTVKKPFSGDGGSFVFGSNSQFEPDANSNGLDTTIYERDLDAGTTQVVSKLPSGETIQNGTGVAELDISEDGSRLVIGQLVSTDAAGNHYYHLYMHLGTSPNTIDLMPGATSGALYGGMTADGSSVYFATKDALTTASEQDTDLSADIYRADVLGGGATLVRVSTGGEGTGDTDSCDPVPNSFGPHWNVVGATADCSAVAVAGGGGVAREEGSIYFLSPERLDGSSGIQGLPNLYVARPGQNPHFLATLESKQTGAAPLPTQHPFVKTFSAPSNPQSMAVDQSASYVYVISTTAGVVRRFDRNGNPANFSAGPGSGTNTLTGFTFSPGASVQTAQVAVDNSGGATDGDLYVTNNSTADPTVKVFSRIGALLGQLSGSSTPEAKFGGTSGALQFPTGVAVDPAGALYVAGGNSGKVYRYLPSANPVAESDYDATLNFGDASNVPGVLAADPNGAAYVHRLNSSGAIELSSGVSRFGAAQFGAAGIQTGTLIDSASSAAYVDPLSGRIYVDRGNSIAEYLPSGVLFGTFGTGKVSSSRGVAVLGSSDGTTTRIYAANGGSGTVSIFDTLPAPNPLVDNPLVAHAVSAAETRSSSDFQVTPSGNDAVFVSTLPLTGFDSGRKEEIFRYDSAAGLDCVSCNPIGARPPADTLLNRFGSNLADDGRVFFTTADPLTLRDSNEKKDAYEWENGAQQLISTGNSAGDSSLLSVSSDGADALFFTRQKLVPEDQNGASVRLYAAREGGGFPFGPPEFQCAASDECHGPSSIPAAPLSAATTAGAPGQFQAQPAARCRRGSVKRRGRCVKRPHHKRATKTKQAGKR
jgi:hypothetical protein